LGHRELVHDAPQNNVVGLDVTLLGIVFLLGLPPHLLETVGDLRPGSGLELLPYERRVVSAFAPTRLERVLIVRTGLTALLRVAVPPAVGDTLLDHSRAIVVFLAGKLIDAPEVRERS